jgi:hypothetical protein
MRIVSRRLICLFIHKSAKDIFNCLDYAQFYSPQPKTLQDTSVGDCGEFEALVISVEALSQMCHSGPISDDAEVIISSVPPSPVYPPSKPYFPSTPPPLKLESPMPEDVNWDTCELGGSDMALRVECILRMRDTSILAHKMDLGMTEAHSDEKFCLSPDEITHILDLMYKHVIRLRDLNPGTCRS